MYSILVDGAGLNFQLKCIQRNNIYKNTVDACVHCTTDASMRMNVSSMSQFVCVDIGQWACMHGRLKLNLKMKNWEGERERERMIEERIATQTTNTYIKLATHSLHKMRQ